MFSFFKNYLTRVVFHTDISYDKGNELSINRDSNTK